MNITTEQLQEKHRLAAQEGALKSVLTLMHKNQLTVEDVVNYAERIEREGVSGERGLSQHRIRNANIVKHREALANAHEARRKASQTEK